METGHCVKLASRITLHFHSPRHTPPHLHSPQASLLPTQSRPHSSHRTSTHTRPTTTMAPRSHSHHGPLVFPLTPLAVGDIPRTDRYTPRVCAVRSSIDPHLQDETRGLLVDSNDDSSGPWLCILCLFARSQAGDRVEFSFGLHLNGRFAGCAIGAVSLLEEATGETGH